MAKTYPTGYGKICWRIPGPNKASDAIITTDYQLLDPPTGAAPTPEQIVAAVANRANLLAITLFTNRLGAGWRYDGARATYRLLLTEYGADSNPLAPITGTIVSPSPPQIALVVRKNSNLVGRRFKGRFYVPGMLADATVDDSGSVLQGTINTLQAAFNSFYAGMLLPATPTEARFAMSIVHTPPITGGPTPAPNQVQSLSVQALTATQRRRIR
jgi:hypothetical protein